MIQEREDVVALDSAVILNPAVWDASGHLEGFSDPLVDCRTQAALPRRRLEQSSCGQKPSVSPGEGPQCDLTEARAFHLMFQTQIGPVLDDASLAYLRPETAQGIFVNFQKSPRPCA